MLHHDVSYSLTSLSPFFFTRRSDVAAYSIVTNSLLKVFVKKSTDEEEMQNDLKKLNPKFFYKTSSSNRKRKIQEEKYRKFR